MNTKTFIILSICFLNCFLLPGQNSYIKKDEAISDIDSLTHALREIHINPFEKYAEELFNNDINTIKKELPDSLTIIEFFKHIGPTVAKLGDGHTQIAFPMNTITENSLLFPIAVNVDSNDSTINVTKDFADNNVTIPKGAQITMINGIDYKEIINNMLEYVSGERTFFRLIKVSNFFAPTMYLLDPSDNFRIVYNHEGNTYEGNVKAKKASEIQTVNQVNNHTPYSFTINEKGNTAILDFRSFRNKDQFRQFADSMFNVIKKNGINNLVIDLRNNGGGDSSIGDILFQYISHQPFQQFSKAINKISPMTRKYAYGKLPEKDSIYTESNFDLIQLEENPLRFDGDIYLLTSHHTYSSAASFSWTFHNLNMGTIIGEETGGMAISYGNIIFYQLPHSKIPVIITYSKFYQFNATDNNIHGTIPDIVMPQEKALEYTLELIEKKHR